MFDLFNTSWLRLYVVLIGGFVLCAPGGTHASIIEIDQLTLSFDRNSPVDCDVNDVLAHGPGASPPTRTTPDPIQPSVSLFDLLKAIRSSGSSSSSSSSQTSVSGGCPLFSVLDVTRARDIEPVAWFHLDLKLHLPTPIGIDLIRPPPHRLSSWGGVFQHSSCFL
jgi:hypothetical protein